MLWQRFHGSVKAKSRITMSKEEQIRIYQWVSAICAVAARRHSAKDSLEECVSDVFCTVVENVERMRHTRPILHLEHFVNRTARFEAQRFFVSNQRRNRSVSAA